MSLAEKLLLEIKTLNVLLAMNDNEAAHYAFNNVDEFTERLDIYVSQHHYKWARMGLIDEVNE